MMMFRLKDLHILGSKAELAWTIGAVFDFFAGTVERAPMWVAGAWFGMALSLAERTEEHVEEIYYW